VYADESIKDSRDVAKAHHLRLVHGVNVKMEKVRGLRGALLLSGLSRLCCAVRGRLVAIAAR
jgi:hypothetical protein